MLSFAEKLQRQWGNGKFLCVGLDPDIKQMPAIILERNISSTVRLYDFCRAIVEATKDVAAAYKLNRAFFEAYGSDGTRALELVVEFIHLNAPDTLIILDAKYGDVPHTNEMYARFAYDHLGVEAVTASPYLGLEVLEPFERHDKGVFVLCRTSNPTAASVQKRRVGIYDVEAESWERYSRFGVRVRNYPDGRQTVSGIPNTSPIPLYEFVARNVNDLASVNLGLVVGGSDPNIISDVREVAPNLPLLVPGIGAQGGNLEACVKAATDINGRGILISASRSIIYASSGNDFAEAAGQAAGDLNRQITVALQ